MHTTHPMEKWRREGGWLYMTALQANDIERRNDVFDALFLNLKDPQPEFNHEWFCYVLQFFDL